MAGATVHEGAETLRETAEAFAAAERSGEPQWLRQLRRDAASAFHRLGIPTTRHEEWRHTNVVPLSKIPFRLPEKDGAGHGVVRRGYAPSSAAVRLVFVDGRFDTKASSIPALPGGTKTGSLAVALRDTPALVEQTLGRLAPHQKHPFVALNTSLLSDGAYLCVPRGVVLAEPVHIVFVSTPSPHPKMTHPRVHVRLYENSQATVVESYAGADEGTTLTNAVTEVVLGPHAFLDHARIQEEGRSTQHLGTTVAHLGAGSQYVSHAFALGASLARHELVAQLHGEGAGATLDGLYAAAGTQHHENKTLIDHARPHGSSQELYKGILDGASRAVFEGKIVVRPGAQKTDAHQTNKNLVLSEQALADSKPQLEIYNNDVRCTHGSTTGRLDPDAFFYLRSRGISPADARALLTHAFASEVTGRVKEPALRQWLEAWLLSFLPRNGASGETP
jgi:Fe-S cluster assembly protein SufD